MTLVGEILERVALEGEYLAKGEEDFKPLPEPAPCLSYAERHQLSQAVSRTLVGAHHECGEGSEQWAYFSFRYELREFICREVIGAGTPWTPNVAKNWKKKMKQVVPPRPDWLAMQKKLLN